MKTSVFERFKVVPPKVNSDGTLDVNLIGFDFGDGEICAYRHDGSVFRTEKNSCERLRFNHGGQEWYQLNELYFNQGIANLTTQVDTPPPKTEVFCSFKRCPNERIIEENADAHYKLDSGNVSPYTYRRLMQHAFCIALEKVMKFNSGSRYIDIDKRTIVFVGRPSSLLWEKSEIAYAELLKEKLTLENVDIVVISEAKAAFAILTKLGSGQGIRPEQSATFIDAGSSTTDFFTISSMNAIGVRRSCEYSRTIGGSNIDKLMVRCAIEQVKKKGFDAEEELKTKPLIHTHMRARKERFYGENGTALDASIYYWTHDPVIDEEFMETVPTETKIHEKGQDGPDDKPKPTQVVIDEEFMKTVLTETKLSNEKPQGGPGDKPHVNLTWEETFRQTCSEAYEEARANGLYTRGTQQCPTPDFLMVTGGVSAMPEVRQWAKECFHTEVYRDDTPRDSVAQGLCYIAATETLKYHYVDRFMKIMLEKVGDSVSKALKEACVVSQYSNMLESLRKWVAEEKDTNAIHWYTELFCPMQTEHPLTEEGKKYFKEEIEKVLMDAQNYAIDTMQEDFIGFLGKAPDQAKLEINQITVDVDWKGVNVPVNLINMASAIYYTKLRRALYIRNASIDRNDKNSLGMFGYWSKERICKTALEPFQKNKIKQIIADSMQAKLQSFKEAENSLCNNVFGDIRKNVTDQIEKMTPYFIE